MAARALKPKPELGLYAPGVSQHTSLLFGFATPRQFLDFLNLHREIPRTRIGKLVIVDSEVLRAALAKLAKANAPKRTTRRGEAPNEIAKAAAVSDQPASADDVLARLGRARAENS